MRRKALLAAASTLLLAAPLLIAGMIALYGVNVAVFDQISIGEFLVRNHGQMVPSLSDLVAQHNESRKVFPRIVIFYLARLTGWDVRYEMAMIFLLACGVAWTFGLLARRSLQTEGMALGATVISTILVFSPVQWWNWLFGIQIVVFIPVLMLLLALYFAERRPLAAAACCFVATYSYANGMLLWLLVAPAVLLNRRSWRTGLTWFALAVAAIAPYFIGYQRPPSHPAMTTALAQPRELAAFVLAFLGHPLVWGDVIAPNAVVGGVVLALFVVFSLAAIRDGRLSAALPWIVVGLYSLGSAVITAVGRLGYGVETAIEPRYTTFAIPLIVAIVMLGFMVTPPPLRHAGIAALALLLVMHASASMREWWFARANYRDRLVARAATQWSAVLSDDSALRRFVHQDGAHAASVIAQLAEIGYVNPPPLTNDLVGTLNGGGLPASNGKFEGVLRLSDGERVFFGWAVLPGRRPADAVLITRADRGAESVVAVSHRTIARPDLQRHTGVLDAGWDLPITAELAVPGTVYTAWGYDTSARRTYKLDGAISVGRRVQTAARY